MGSCHDALAARAGACCLERAWPPCVPSVPWGQRGGGRIRSTRAPPPSSPPCPFPPGNLPGPVAGHPTYGRRPGHRTAIARRGAGGEGPGAGGRRVPFGGAAAVRLLAPGSRFALSGRFRLRLDSLRGRLWRHPGPQFMTVGSFAFAQRPLLPPPPLISCLVARLLVLWAALSGRSFRGSTGCGFFMLV